MQFQDVITYKQKVLMFIHDEETSRLLEDENLRTVLAFLRKGPMTLEELDIAFKKIDNEKSDKTIYRYLNILANGNLVAKAGKRIIIDENSEIKTQTLYARRAKIFFTKYSERAEETFEVRGKAIQILLSQLFDNKKGSAKCIKNLLNKIDTRYRELIVEIFETADEEVFELLAQLDWDGINDVLEVIAWLALSQEIALREKVASCYKTKEE